MPPTRPDLLHGHKPRGESTHLEVGGDRAGPYAGTAEACQSIETSRDRDVWQSAVMCAGGTLEGERLSSVRAKSCVLRWPDRAVQLRGEHVRQRVASTRPAGCGTRPPSAG